MQELGINLLATNGPYIICLPLLVDSSPFDLRVSSSKGIVVSAALVLFSSVMLLFASSWSPVFDLADFAKFALIIDV